MKFVLWSKPKTRKKNCSDEKNVEFWRNQTEKLYTQYEFRFFVFPMFFSFFFIKIACEKHKIRMSNQYTKIPKKKEKFKWFDVELLIIINGSEICVFHVQTFTGDWK